MVTSISTTSEDKTTEPEESTDQLSQSNSSLDILRNKPFWIWDKT